MITCEYCGRKLRVGDTIHGIKYGTLTTSGFKAAQDSAVVVICETCGNRICNIVYGYLDEGKMAYPLIFNMYNELTSLMKNGYKLIRSIAKLPRADQLALQHLITACKQTK